MVILLYFGHSIFFSNAKLKLVRREQNIQEFIQGRTNYKQFFTTSLQYTERT